VAKLGALYTDALRRREVRAGRTWHLDEMAVRVGGRREWLWRAVDEHGQTLDILRQAHRDTAAALREVPELAGIEHLQVRSAQRCNNRVEQAHRKRSTRTG